MTNEEKKAIEKFKNIIYTYQDVIEDEYSDYEEKESAKEYQEVSETILNLLEKQDNRIKELESDKEINVKMIDLMAEHLTTPIHSKKDVVEYFENLAKESGEIDEDNRIIE